MINDYARFVDSTTSRARPSHKSALSASGRQQARTGTTRTQRREKRRKKGLFLGEKVNAWKQGRSTQDVRISQLIFGIGNSEFSTKV